MSFDAHEDKVRQLFGRKVYNIPRNQRKYVWKKDNWQELFDDVMAVVDGIFPSHFLGSIVLKTDPMENGLSHYSIIDGQQRTITLTIFLTSIMFWMKKFEMYDDFSGTLQYVIAKDDKNRDMVMVTSENHGTLEHIINTIVHLTDESIKRATVTSIVDGHTLNKRDEDIAEAFKFFLNAVYKQYEASENDLQILIKLRDAVCDITFVNIVATTEEDSYTIFEILNARGSDLEDHELLKNYIMRYIQPEANRDRAKIEWNHIEETLGYSNLKDFIRHYTTHRYEYSRSQDTSNYKIIRDKNKGSDTLALLYDLEKKANYYLKLVSPIKDGENANCSEIEHRIYSFFKKKRQKQMRPLLLSLITQNVDGNLSDELYEDILEFLYNFYVCYNIIGEENSNRLTNIVNKYAVVLSCDCSEDIINQLIEELKNKLPSQAMFINSFKNVGWSHHGSIYDGDKNKMRTQTILEILERYHNYGNCLEDFTVEHVFPDSDSTENGQIGNLIPLEERLNRQCKDKELAEKIKIYANSSYSTARRFAERYSNGEFDPKVRTEFMAKEFYTRILKLHQDTQM